MAEKSNYQQWIGKYNSAIHIDKAAVRDYARRDS